MTIRKVYAAAQGPFLYDDTQLINDPDGDYVGEYRQVLISDGSMHLGEMICDKTPVDPHDVVRLEDLSDLSLIDGDQLEIDWNPSTYIPVTALGYTTSVDQLTSHLRGIDQKLSVLTDGDQLDIDWNPTLYVPAIAAGYSTGVDDLTSHLKGIDNYMINLETYLSAGFSGTFTNGDGDTVTVVNSMIRSVV